MSYDIQSKNGLEQNKMYEEDTAFHDWYRFVLSYPPHLVRHYLEKFEIHQDSVVLDPFCGTATTLVESKKLGIHSIGIEANPMAQFAAATKLQWDLNPTDLVSQSTKIAQEAELQIKNYQGDLRNLTTEQQKLIIQDSISPIPLHKALILLDVIKNFQAQSEDSKIYDVQRLAFAKQVVFSYSNLHFGPEVGISRCKKTDAPVVDVWLQQVTKMAEDLQQAISHPDVLSRVHLGDARAIRTISDLPFVDCVITSPPYPNEKDYTRTTRLESVLLGFITEKNDLRTNKKRLLRSNSRNIYKGDRDEEYIFHSHRVLELADHIEQKRIALGKTSGFEKMYSRVVKSYFGGMMWHLQELQAVLKPGAKLAYVVGDQASYFRIPIRTGEILADLAADAGYTVLGIDLFRTRLSTVTKEWLREEVVLLQWN